MNNESMINKDYNMERLLRATNIFYNAVIIKLILLKSEMGGTCSSDGRGKRRGQGFGGGT
jgi:hypothetical protein